ncbi:hypothetical protein ACFLQ2_02800 [archaeon]
MPGKELEERAPFDRDKFLLKMGKKSARDVKKLMSAKPPELKSLDPELKKLVEERMKTPLSAFDLKYRLFGVGNYGKKYKKEQVGRYKLESQAMFIAGQLHLKDEPLDALYSYFWPVAQAHLSMPEYKMPGGIGRRSLRVAKLISKAWVHSHAFDYANLELKDFKPFYGGHETRTVWSALGVDILGRAGDVEDIPALDQISEKCWEGSMEGDCGAARRKIISRAALKATLDREQLEKVGLKTKLSDVHLIDKLVPLMNVSGLSYVLQAFPGMKGMARLSTNPVEASLEAKEIKKIVQKGVGREFEFKPGMFAEGEEYAYYGSAQSFAEEHGLIKDTGRKEYRSSRKFFKFTPKGKKFIKALFKGLKDIQIKF